MCVCVGESGCVGACVKLCVRVCVCEFMCASENVCVCVCVCVCEFVCVCVCDLIMYISQGVRACCIIMYCVPLVAAQLATSWAVSPRFCAFDIIMYCILRRLSSLPHNVWFPRCLGMWHHNAWFPHVLEHSAS